MSVLDTVTYNGVDYSIGGGGGGTPVSDVPTDISTAYLYPTYSAKALNNDGTLSDSQIAYSTDYLPVEEGESLILSSALTTKVAYYNASKTFLNLISTTTGINVYTVPAGAKYAIFQNVLQGSIKPFNVRKKAVPINESFSDLIWSPLKSNPTICITGDSNTAGYGLSDASLSWANMFMDAISDNIQAVNYQSDNPKWCEQFGANKYSSASTNYKNYSQMSIWTDATSVRLNIKSNYSSTYDWYVDDVLQVGFTTTSELTGLDGNLHKVTVKFTGGQAVDPVFVITKNISYTNKGVSGVSSANMQFDSGKDWLIVMIGTNNRAINPGGININLVEYKGKGTYICPFPNHKTDSSYVYSQMYTYGNLIRLFKSYGYEILDTGMFANEFYDNDELYQSDLIHFNALGHRKIANIVSGMMGFPLCLKET